MTNHAEQTSTPISLPKGGGAIKGIGETFQPNLFIGTGNFSIPIFTSPGRNGFGPQLAVQYSTGNGNSPFGLGWQLSIPRITRKTEKGLPTYNDQDVFVMSGAEDLVPYLQQSVDDPDQWTQLKTTLGEMGEEFTITLYRPRSEGEFARIERWERDGEIHWRVTTKENITSIYGFNATARISDPQNPKHVYEWLLEETFDAKGNHMLYEYVQEDPTLQLPGIHEQNRSYTQAYIRRILYGNTPENIEDERKAGPIRTATDHTNPLKTRERHYLFEVLFDYEKQLENIKDENHSLAADPGHDKETTVPSDWPVREDPFSTFRAGFEIRTLRRCRRVLMRHYFNEDELAGAPLVKSTDFRYEVNPETKLSFLTSATVSGYRKDPDNPTLYLKRSLPPVTFKYSAFEPDQQRYQSVTAKGREMPPRSIGAPDFTFMDVFGNGLPDILQDTGAGFHYWQNLGEGQLDRRRPQSSGQPVHSFAEANVSVGDMGGDGLADLVVDAPPISGFYESKPNGEWKPFKRFETMPSFNLSDANTRLIDLTGDGLSDVLVTRDNHFLWFRCLGEAGYGEPLSVSRKHDLDAFPDVYFDDPAGRVRLADMTGDGLSDIVLVHDGRIDYWPNLGYGKFGRRLTMANTPRIGYGYDPRRLFLADLDGSGCADLVYVEHCQVRFWFNQSGNAWSDEQIVDGTPAISDLTAIQFTDFYGTGTTTLLWSYDFGQHPGGSNYKILDFCGGNKPNLLVEMDNNMGATTRVQYAPSTKFYLEDKANGTPWFTNLPFPVQVLEKTEVIDHISKTKLVTIYKYHHGYYDGREREFRGFGRVDQIDTEFFEKFSKTGLHSEEIIFDNNQKGFHVPPVETRTWFHTGVYFDEEWYLDFRELAEQYRREYYSGDKDAFQLEDPVIKQPDGSIGNGDTPHEAYRALRGAVLRSEVYAQDDTEKSEHPYTVTETRYQVKALQPRDSNNHAVYLTTTNESLSYHYERNPTDPRISHSITLGIDEFGNVTNSVAIGYPRRIVPDELPEQGETKIVYSRTDFINHYRPPSASDSGFYYAGIPFQSREYDVSGINWSSGQPRFTAELFKEKIILDKSAEVDIDSFKPYEWQRDTADSDVHRRIIEWTRSYFRTNVDPNLIDGIDNLKHRLSLGKIESLALPFESYQAVFTNSLLQEVYGDRIKDKVIDLAGEGGYHPHPNHPKAEGTGGIKDYWWIPSGRQNFAPDKFFQPDLAQDPFGNIATTESDVYALLMETAKDALPEQQANVITAKNDYRVLQPFEITDPNGNRSEVRFDALGLVVGTAIMGKQVQNGESEGDSLKNFVADLTDEVRNRHINDPLNLDTTDDTNPHNILQGATTRLVYNLNRYARIDENYQVVTTGEPNVVYTLARETHVSDERGVPSKTQHAFVYSDGFGREFQTKVQAEPHRDTPEKPRWIGTGTTIYNNKGKAVQQYEPFFSDDHHHGIEQHGVSPTLFYDPLQRVVCTVNPNHTYEKVLFDPWQQTTWDSNDTVLLNPRDDDDVRDYVAEYFDQYDREYEDEQGEKPKTWFDARISSDDTASKAAAKKTRPHANTLTVAHLDSLGRPYLTIADNGVDDEGNAQKYATRVVLDIEDNQHEVIDARNLAVMRYAYNMLSIPIHQSSMDAGERWMLNDAADQPFYTWDGNERVLEDVTTVFEHRIFHTTYDPLRRPLQQGLQINGEQERVIERFVYGETHREAEDHNLRGQTYQHYDASGLMTGEDFDFKGNLLEVTRQLASAYDATVIHWPENPSPDTLEESYTQSTRYDALNHIVRQENWHLSGRDPAIYTSQYNERSLLSSETLSLHGEIKEAILNIEHDAKGQRTKIQYGNGTTTRYSYDTQTFRLQQLRTTRTSPGDPLPTSPSGLSDSNVFQNLYYTYDPVGNITEILDDAYEPVFFKNQQVESRSAYTYDPLYRLVEATGRENIHARSAPTQFEKAPFAVNFPITDQALRNYRQFYRYDDVGNIKLMRHVAEGDLWTRNYEYADDSNRLLRTWLGVNEVDAIVYKYDTHGSMLNPNRTPDEFNLRWDYHDMIHHINLGGGGQAFYNYDADKQRTRKRIERKNNIIEERIYLGGMERYRRWVGDQLKEEIVTYHLFDSEQRVLIVEDVLTTDSGILDEGVLFRYQYSNNLGSVGVELDAEGEIISYEEYHPYGTSAYRASNKDIKATAKRYRYTGMERDEESGLSYHSARYYLPWLGRWGSVDSEGLIDGTNLYCYVKNNSIVKVDPTGNQAKPKIIHSPIKTAKVAGENSLERASRIWKTNAHMVPDTVVGSAAVSGTSIITISSGATAIATLGNLYLTTNFFMKRMANIARFKNPLGIPRGRIGLSNVRPWNRPFTLDVSQSRPNGPLAGPKSTTKIDATPIPETKSKPDNEENKRKGKFEWHHIAPHNNSKSSAGPLSKIINDADISIHSSPHNLVRLPEYEHNGPHPPEYDAYVLNELKERTDGIIPHTDEYTAAVKVGLFILRLKLSDPSSDLRKMVRERKFTPTSRDTPNKMSPHKIDKETTGIDDPNNWGKLREVREIEICNFCK